MADLILLVPRVRIELTTPASSVIIWTISSSVLEVGRFPRKIHILRGTPLRDSLYTFPVLCRQRTGLGSGLLCDEVSPNSPNYSIRLPTKGPEDFRAALYH